ncbi:MAG: hypothetical protein R3Y04_04670, partial [Rikenellaceae bacterium]
NNNTLASYKDWPVVTNEDVESSDLFFGSGGGTLFPAHSLHKDVLNRELFMRLTPHADDVWLNAMVKLNGRRVIKTDSDIVILNVKIGADTTLSSINNDQNQNDIQIANVNDYYKQQPLA